MRLTIVSVAYPLAPVCADSVGGAEKVLSQLDRALMRAGHRSIVIACAGSRIAGELVAFDAPPAFGNDALVTAERQVEQALTSVLRRRAANLVHIHALDFAALLPQSDFPTLVTLHMPRSYYSDRDLQTRRPNLWMNCVSHAQSATFTDVANVVATIENGVQIERRRPVPAHARGFALWMGRICPEKAPHLAIDATMNAGAALVLAGRTFPYPAHQQYFESQIAGRLGPRCRFIGRVGGTCKRTLLRHARCLIVSTQAPETSSLAAREALAAGTPVVAYRTPALEHLIEHGSTGFLVDDDRGLTEAIRSAHTLDPIACIRAARSRCDEARTTAEYLQIYESLLRGTDRRAVAAG